MVRQWGEQWGRAQQPDLSRWGVAKLFGPHIAVVVVVALTQVNSGGPFCWRANRHCENETTNRL